MRRALAILFLLSVAALAAFTPPKPRARTVTSSFELAPDSTVTARLDVTVTGTMQPGDSIRYKVYKDGLVVVNKLSVATNYLATGMPAPAYGATSSYKPCAVMTRSQVNQGSEVCGTAWVYTRPSLPVPTVGGVIITPASVTVQPGQTVTFVATDS
jgi:hypothetical protein